MTAEAVIRPATTDDVPALEAVVIVNEPGLAAGAHEAYLAHLVERVGRRFPRRQPPGE